MIFGENFISVLVWQNIACTISFTPEQQEPEVQVCTRICIHTASESRKLPRGSQPANNNIFCDFIVRTTRLFVPTRPSAHFLRVFGPGTLPRNNMSQINKFMLLFLLDPILIIFEQND